MQKSINLIEKVVRDFYKVAINDIFLAYQFNKINKNPNKYENLERDLGDFEDHIPKVVDFWAVQLLPNYKSAMQRENVIKVHRYLNIHRGELGRWLKIFKTNLENYDGQLDDELKQRWLEKLDIFEKSFEILFNHKS